MKNIASKLNFNLEKKTIKLIIFFEIISFFISLTGIVFLYIFLKHFISFDFYDIGIILFRTGLLGGVCSLCFGTFFNAINTGAIHK